VADNLISPEVAWRRALRRMFLSLGFITVVGIAGVISSLFIDSWWPFIITAVLVLGSLVLHALGDRRDRKRTSLL
jgi:hypothetical protein